MLTSEKPPSIPQATPCLKSLLNVLLSLLENNQWKDWFSLDSWFGIVVGFFFFLGWGWGIAGLKSSNLRIGIFL